jgi:hypothetical protein
VYENLLQYYFNSAKGSAGRGDAFRSWCIKSLWEACDHRWPTAETLDIGHKDYLRGWGDQHNMLEGDKLVHLGAASLIRLPTLHSLLLSGGNGAAPGHVESTLNMDLD